MCGNKIFLETLDRRNRICQFVKRTCSLNSELGVCFPRTLYLRYELRTKKTQQLNRRRIVVWWKGAPLRLRLCKTRPPHFVALQGRWGEFRGALKKQISRIYPRKTISHYFLGRSWSLAPSDKNVDALVCRIMGVESGCRTEVRT